MKEQKMIGSTFRFAALFLLAILFTQYSIVCINASASQIPEQAEASIIVQSDDHASMENHCATKTGCVHPCHFTTMSTPDLEEDSFLPKFQKTCRESISPLTAPHAVFHPPRLS